ncbi:NAD(P)-dependent dehydrogenase (short-subunit alcohol dehydrogenase family) [Chitinophaga skermanii]|uniref:NAD(P)-dependent dehydrogenase (Short-subunit alcohol dehydrogenase family) n=1 Tax=Chitinophaga skermanii TaxID=331697 RepID=A0A327QNH7_9BACT|nr:short chain dehydrogenase [Chitinophaga skermanii]RAJ05212.1 NAD(P)-dependent dehydrogenase (short-subunit alcohol dehydrogenase family) [Chitinophaga skermanii]
MKILLIGGEGTIGKGVATAFRSREQEVITAGRNSGQIQVDITQPTSIEQMFQQVGPVDAIICTAGTGYYGPFHTMTTDLMLPGIQGKLLGQINLVLIGKSYLNKGGSFTLTSGIAAEHPARNGTCVAMINGAVNSFVLGAAQEMVDEKRINVVSPGLVAASAERYGAFFPGYNLVPMDKLVNAYILSVEGAVNGKILKVYN